MATNGVYIVMGEANCVVALLNKARRQYQLSQSATMEDTDPLLRNFTDLKEVLNKVADLADMNPQTYLSPFLDVIKAHNTNGPITEAALAAVAKFLNYGLIDASSIKAANAVESIAYAVVHTKFIGGKTTGSDECVMFKILQVLRSLLLSPSGILLSNEGVCDMMQSCFKIVFEQNLSLLLRKAAESTLADMTQLIFTRLPTFVEDTRHLYIRQLVNPTEKRQKRKKKRQFSTHVEPKEEKNDKNCSESTKLITTATDMETDGAVNLGFDVVPPPGPPVDKMAQPDLTVEEIKHQQISEGDEADSESEGVQQERPIRGHTGLQREIVSDEEDPLLNENVVGGEEKMPYGLPCCKELLRFLITMINPIDRHNTESMVVLGLNLLVVALEAVADFLPNYDILMPFIKNELCRSLLQLLDTEKLPVLAATNRCCFLLFESMRMHLKFQLESYLKKLQSIVLSEKDHTNNGTEQKEMALESLVQLWRIPGLVTEMYLNFDCDLYCGNIFEDLTKLLVENSFPTLGGHTASLLSLDALLVVIETIEQNCDDRANGRREVSNEQEQKDLKKLDLPVLSGYDIAKKMINPGAEVRESFPSTTPIPQTSSILLRSNRHAPSTELPSMTQIIEQKKRKRLIAEGTELFNQSPKKGIAFLREKGILGHDEQSLVQWLRTNPQLDKKAIADYICNRKHAEVLGAFVRSFPFENTRLDIALRMFLETFRLPGESAEISLVMQHFSDEWFKANNEPFNHVDAAFTLSYAIIMLNVDQHNPQAKRSQPPMTVDCFKRNLSGTNGNKDFDPEMLAEMYQAIKTEEIVMPAEQKGSVKEDYMWKVLLRRGQTSEGSFYHAPTGWNDHDLFAVCWGPAVAALSYVFDKSEHEQILQKALTGYRKCAKISAYYGMKEVFDNLCIHLCKFTTLTSMRDGGEESLDLQRHRSMIDISGNTNSVSSFGGLPTHSPEAVSLAFGENHKAQLATQTLFYLVHENGNILREGWRNLFEVLLHLFRARLLPSDLTEVEDYVDEKGWVSIQRVHQKELPSTRNDSGLLSWFGLGGSTSEADRRKPTQEQLSSMKLASQVIAECRPSQIIADSKYLTSTSLAEMLSSIAASSAMILELAEPQQKTASLSGEDEDALVFYLELIVAITLENKDRLPLVWPHVRRHLEWLLSPKFGRCPVLVERAVVGLLRVANRNLFRDNTVSDDVIHSLSMLLRLSSKALFIFSRQIAFGLYELIRANAANVHKKEHWDVLFALLEASGAAALPENYVPQVEKQSFKIGDNQRNAYSDVEDSSKRGTGYDERAYTSEGEERKIAKYDSTSDPDSRINSAGSLTGTQKQPADWIHLDHKDAARATEEALNALGANAHKRNFRQFGSIVLRNGLGRHEPAAFLKVCECLAFLLRDAVHVTPDNFESSLRCLRTLVEASLDGGVYAAGPPSGDAQNRLRSTATEERASRKQNYHYHSHGKKTDTSSDVAKEVEESKNEEQQLSANYQQMSLHLLDLCSQLHSQTPSIFAKWAQQEGVSRPELASVTFIWTDVWRPLLQAMGRLSCDCRRGVRAAALTHLQRAFLPANMTALGAAEWQSCFGDVLFPLLTKLLEPFSPMDPIGMEDTRVRTLQIVAKMLLNHLSALSALDSFSSLWMLLLDYMEQYLNVDSCGNLKEAVPESLKNMLLVMDSTDIFASIPELYTMTVERLNRFMPQLIKDTIPNPPSQERMTSSIRRPTEPANQVVHSEFQEKSVQGKCSTGLEPPSSSTDDTSFSENSMSHSSQSCISTTQTSEHISFYSEDSSASATTPIPIQQPLIPLTEVIVHSGPTSPFGSPPQYHSTETSMSQQSQYDQYQQQAAAHQYQQYQNYQQQQHHQSSNNPHQNVQYSYSPEATAYYQQQYAQQQQQYADHYANQYQPYQQQHQTGNYKIPSVHGQYSVANPLPTPTYPAAYHPIVAPSANSAFSQVYATPQNSMSSTSTAVASVQDPSYFTPIQQNQQQQQQP